MKTFARFISNTFQPVLVPTFGIALFMLLPPYSFLETFNAYKIIVVLGTLFFTGVLPASVILYMMHKGNVSDLFISKKEQRILPYAFSVISYLFWIFFLWKTVQLPLYIVGIAIGSILALVIIMFINKYWKISAHLATMGGFVGGAFGVCFQNGINPILFLVSTLVLSGLVMWSRITLKAHTPLQTVAGLILGIICGFIPCLIL